MTPAEPLRLVLLGASGFVGSAVLRAVLGGGARAPLVHALVHHTRPKAIAPYIRLFPGSVTALPDGLLPDAPHVILHCASKQIDRDGSGYGVNPDGIAALAAAATSQTRAVLFLSSFSVYGEAAQLGITEDVAPRPDSSLARSRAACEAQLEALAAAGRFAVASLRTRLIVGRGDRHVLPALLRLAQSRIAIGSGTQRLTIIDVDDLAQVLLRLAENMLREDPQRPGFTAYNTGYHRPIAVGEIFELIAQRFGTLRPLWRLPADQRLIRALRALPSRRLRETAQRLQLIGADHYGSIARLEMQLGGRLLATDPREAIRRATLALFMEQQAWH